MRVAAVHLMKNLYSLLQHYKTGIEIQCKINAGLLY